MNKILTRKEFIDVFNELMNGHGTVDVHDHPLWIPESIDHQKVECSWFIKVKPLKLQDMAKNQYWSWVHNSCSGKVLCFCSDSDNDEEWWGFTVKEDITLWLLKWIVR